MNLTALLTTALADRYLIEREIGTGGMATVYLARDVKHNRPVALKVLKPELAAVLGVDRFLAEIEITANLQHPNLLPLFDSGEANGLLFYVMPYVEGESLRAKLDREKQLPVDDAVRMTLAIAGALDYAHRHGVIHRDLKPENVLLHEGQPLVADFGIALAVSNAGGNRVTQTGISLGTPQYMSPEQATGDRAIDARTDIYSLGAVAYEMLTGEPPHAASTAQAVMAKLLVEDPRPLTILRRSVPVHVDAAIRRALERLPADRFTTAKEFADALSAKGDGVPAFATGAVRARRRAASAAVLGVAVISVVTALATVWKLARVAEPQSVQFKLDVPDGQQLVAHSGAPIAISPDGRTLAYLATGAQSPLIFVRRLADLQSAAYPVPSSAADLKFSADGRSISFDAENDRVQSISATGGPVAVVARGRLIRGTSWSSDGGFVYADSGAIWFAAAPGVSPRRIAGVAPNQHLDNVELPFVFPNAKDVMFWIMDGAAPRLAIASMSGPKITTFNTPVGNVLGYMDGWLIYGRNDGVIAAQRFDQRGRRFSGEAVTLLDGPTWQDEGGLEAVLSASGTLAYVRDAASSLTLVDAKGVAQPTAVSGAYSNPAWSPNGKKIAVEKVGFAGGASGSSGSFSSSSIWIYDVASRALSRVTGTQTFASRPSWTADGKRIAYQSVSLANSKSVDAPGAISSVPADLSGPEELLYSASDVQFRGVTFSPDGKFAVLRTDNALRSSRADIYALPLADAAKRIAIPIIQTIAQEEMPAVSPDSRWLAYQSDETGRAEIYVRPFPAGGGRVQVSADGGEAPRWAPDGSHIVYRGPRAFWSATLATSTGIPQITRRDSLFADTYRRTDADHQGYDIARDGRFALFRASGNVEIVVITNWWNEARAKLRGK